MRATYGAIAAIGVFVGFRYDDALVRELAGIGVVAGATAALVVSVIRRRAGVAGERERIAVRSARVAAMTGIDRAIDGPVDGVPEFPPALDLIAPAIGFVGLVAAADVAGGPFALSLLRILAGAAFLGAVTDAMLLGHWYLVQPGLGPRAPARAGPLDRPAVADRGRRHAPAHRDVLRVQRLDRRRLRRDPRLVLGRLRPHHHRPASS